jgi:hypothetical protein
MVPLNERGPGYRTFPQQYLLAHFTWVIIYHMYVFGGRAWMMQVTEVKYGNVTLFEGVPFLS